MTAKHIIFTGRVQGVGFRFTTHRIALRHQLTGWVRNLPDGTVEMFAQGSGQDITDCIAHIEDIFAGYITDTKTEDAQPDPTAGDFKITF